MVNDQIGVFAFYKNKGGKIEIVKQPYLQWRQKTEI